MSRQITFDVGVDTGDSVKTLGTMRSELEQINEELEQVEVGSKEFVKLSDRARNVSSEIKTLEKTFEGLEPQQKTEAFVKGFEGIAGAVAVTAGSMALFGVESERIGEIEAKVQGAIAIAIGARSVAEGALQARIAARIVQEKAAAVATKAATVAQRAFNIVASANPLGLIITAVTGLVLVFTKFGKKITDFIKNSLGPLNTALEKAGKFLRMVGSALGLVASEEELAAEKTKELANERVKSLERQLKVSQAAGEETIELERRILDEKMKLYEKDSDEYKDLVADKAALEAGYQKEITDKQNAAAAERRKKREEEAKKREEERKAQAEKEAAEAEAEAQRAADNEEKRLAAIQGKLDEYKKRQEDIEAVTNEEKVLLEQERALAELERLQATEEQKAQVLEFYSQRVAEARKADEEATTAVMAEEAKNQQAINDAKIAAQFEFAGAVGGVIRELSGLLGEGTAAGKAAALADIAVTTGLGFAKGLEIAQKSAAGTGPAAAFAFPIFYATQIAAVLAAVGKAKAVLSAVPGGGGGGGTPSAPGRGGGGTPQPITSIGQLAEGSIFTPTTAEASQTPGRVYVVASDVTTEQEANARLNSRRTLGGG